MPRLTIVRTALSTTALVTLSLVAAAPAHAAADAAAADAAAGAAAVAEAADAVAEGEGGLTEIIVTAQKREENLQKTPIAISVLTGQGLEDRHVTSLVDLGDGAIPSLKVAPFFSRPGALIVNVRGVGVLSDSNQPARDQGVGVYVNGVYLGRPQGLGTALFDVASMEVLKGPQGTLFGRNTEGGAVNIVTKKPSGQFKMDLTAGMGNYSSYDARLRLDLPEVANVSLKLDGVISRRGAFVKNPLPGNEGFNSFNKRGFRIEALWKPAPGFTADLSFDSSWDATSTLYQAFLGAPYAVPASANDPAIPANVIAAATPVQPYRVKTAAVGAVQQPSIGKVEGLGLNLEWQAATNLTLKSITAYRWLNQSQYDNAGVASSFVTRPVANFNTNGSFGRYSLAFFRQNQVSEELQAIGELPRVKFAMGAMWYQERVEDSAQAPFTTSFLDAAGSTFSYLPNAVQNAVVQRASHVVTTSIGAYGQATYTPPIANDIVHLTGGLRWTNDKKDGLLFTVNGAAPIVPVNGQNVQAAIPLRYNRSRVDPMINLSLDLARDIHAYGKWSTGYKSGGANSRSTNYARFDPETVSMFEIGLKSELFDNKVRLNLAAYTGTYKGIQLDFSGQYEDFVNGVRVVTTRTTTDTVNAPGTGKLKGFEAELTVAPVTGLTLSGSFAYNSVKIPDTLNPFKQRVNGVDITPINPQKIYQVYTPKYSGSVAADYETPVLGATLRAHLDANFDSGFYINYTDVLLDSRTQAVRIAQPKGDPAFVMNGRLTLADLDMGGGAKLDVSLWARNLTNKAYVFYRSTSPTAGTTGFFNDPRTWGVELRVKM